MRGTPMTARCPRCHRGQFNHPRSVKGVRSTGLVEPRITRSAHRAGASGAGFIGYRGQFECLDCGHKWFSTHPDSGRVHALSKGPIDAVKMLCFCGGRLLPQSLGGVVLFKEDGKHRVYEVRCERCLTSTTVRRDTCFPSLPAPRCRSCNGVGGRCSRCGGSGEGT